MAAEKSKNQLVAIGLGVVAVFLFAIYDYKVSDITKVISVDALISYRMVFSFVFYFIALAALTLFKVEDNIPLQYWPTNIDGILYWRGFATILYLALLAFALSQSKSLLVAYPFFFFHPIWQVLWGKALSGKWPPIASQALPVALILSGVAIFTAWNISRGEGTWQEQLWEAAPYNVPAFLAGIGFAYTNESSNYIKNKAKRYPMKFVGKEKRDAVSGLRIATYTSYAAMLEMTVMWLVIAVCLKAVKIDSNMIDSQTNMAHLTDNIWMISLACLVVALGNWAFTEAFTKATQTAQIAALDALIFVYGAILDWKNLPTSDPRLHWYVIALALIAVGAGWSAVRADSQDLYG